MIEKYKFSVIIPIYNVGKYLEETILSVINQTIGFKNNIQMILVNDGSTDNSEEICIKYQKQYPQNIKYIYQENQGVSSARNKGMEFIEGKYVNCLDSDDVWDLDVFEKVYKFFEENKNDIDIVACRQKFFGVRDGYHKLDYKFYNDHIVDIFNDYEEIQLSMSSAFIRSNIMIKYRYDTRLKYSEDATLIGQIIMNKSKYGILSNAVYNYRKREDGTSALQTREGNMSWYFDTIEYGYKLLIQKSMEKYGKILAYFQYHIMYDIQWRINVNTKVYLSEKKQNKYIYSLIELLNYIDDDIIFKQKYLKKEYKILALCLKYKRDIRSDFYYEDSKIRFNGINIYKIKNNSMLKIDNLLIKDNDDNNGYLIINGRITSLLPKEDYKVFIKYEDGRKKYIKKYKNVYEIDSVVGVLNNAKEFTIKIPLENNIEKIRFVMEYKSNRKSLIINFNQLAKLSNENYELFFSQNGYIITSEKEQIIIKKSSMKEIKERKEQYKRFLKESNQIELLNLRNKIGKRKLKIINIYIKFVDDEMYILKTIKRWNNLFIEGKKWKKVDLPLELKKYIILKSKIVVGNEKNIKNIFLEEEEYIKDLYQFKYIK